VISRLLGRLNGASLSAKLVRIASGSFLIQIAGAGLAFCLQLFLGRILNASNYGAYVYVITCINFLTLPALLGLDTAALRFIPQYIGKNQFDLVFGFITRSKQIVLFAGLIIIAGTYVYLQMEMNRFESNSYQLFIIAIFLLPINAILRLNGNILRSLHCVLVPQIIQAILRPLIIAAGVIIAFLYARDSLTEIAMLSNVLSGFLLVVILSIILKNRLNRIIPDKKKSFETREWFLVALPLLFNTGFNVILSQADIVMIGYFLNSEQVGVYAAATRTASLVIFVLTAVNSIAAPMISQLYSEHKKLELQRIVTLSARLTFIVSLPLCIILIIWGREVLSLFGAEFSQGSHALVYLASAQLFSALAGSVGFIMIMTGHQHQANLILVVSAIVNIVANYFLIPEFGINGAAYATSISIVAWNLLMYLYTHRIVGLNPTILCWK
jgi:O-antigen/teichoic acid export membrane protein